MKGAVLYIAIDCENVSAAQSMIRNFIAAGLQDTDPRVHISIGDAGTRCQEGNQTMTTNHTERSKDA